MMASEVDHALLLSSIGEPRDAIDGEEGMAVPM